MKRQVARERADQTLKVATVPPPPDPPPPRVEGYAETPAQPAVQAAAEAPPLIAPPPCGHAPIAPPVTAPVDPSLAAEPLAARAPSDGTGAHTAVLGEDAMSALEGDLPVLEVNLGASTESNLYVGLSGDVGRGGVLAATYERLPLGARTALRLTFPGGLETVALGIVRFVRDGFEVDDRPGLGIKFIAVSEDGLALIQSFAAHREPAFLSE